MITLLPRFFYAESFDTIISLTNNAMPVPNKVIINMALTGMVPTREMTAHVPLTPKEIIKDALMCAKLGAGIVHIHARDKAGKPTWKKEIYAEIISGIREKNQDILITVSTSGRNWSEFEKRSQVLELEGDLKPDMATLTMGSMNFINSASVNSPEMIEKLAEKAQSNQIKLEFEIFETGMIHKVNFLLERGLIVDKTPYFNIFLGNLGTAPFDASTAAAMLNLLPNNALWAFAGLGRFQLSANVLALSLGGGVRVGLEDNIYFDQNKQKLATNSALLKRLQRIMKEMHLEGYSAKELRKVFGLRQ